jgi:hypothetical protein
MKSGRGIMKGLSAIIFILISLSAASIQAEQDRKSKSDLPELPELPDLPPKATEAARAAFDRSLERTSAPLKGSPEEDTTPKPEVEGKQRKQRSFFLDWLKKVYGELPISENKRAQEAVNDARNFRFPPKHGVTSGT